MFRPFRPSLEKLENREVFSAGPLGLAAAAQPQDVIHPFSDLAIQSSAAPFSGAASHNGGAIHFGTRAVSNANLASAAPSASAETDGDSDGADFLAWQRQARPADKTAAADFDNDGDVDGADFLAWQRQAQPADQAAPSAIWLEGTYRSNRLSVVNFNPVSDHVFDPSTGIWYLRPQQASGKPPVGNEFGDLLSQHAAAHDAVFAEIGKPLASVTDLVIDPFDAIVGSPEYYRSVRSDHLKAAPGTGASLLNHTAGLDTHGVRSMQQNYDLTLAQSW